MPNNFHAGTVELISQLDIHTTIMSKCYTTLSSYQTVRIAEPIHTHAHYNLTDLNLFRKSVSEFCPFIDSATMDLAKDFELPGFPTTNRGILSSMHTAIMNTFSLRAALRAMFGPSTMFERNTS